MLIVLLRAAVYIFGASKSKHVKAILMAKTSQKSCSGWNNIGLDSDLAYQTFWDWPWKVEIRICRNQRVQKKVAERLVRGGMCWSHQGNITRLMQFSIIWKQGDYSAFVSLKLPASLSSAPITVQPNGSLSRMMNRSWAYTLVPNFHFPCICLKSFLILTHTAASEPSVALVLTVILVITALTGSL